MTRSDNVIVSEGWGIMRNIANVAIVFALVATAISIIVGYKETEAKKALVKFILIALLINFTPVICGLLIDASNLAMSNFLKGGASPSFSQALTQGMQNADLASIPAMLVLVIFTFLSALVYFLYAALFIARYVVLWILVIVSPLAFATKAFPEFKYIKKIFPSVCYWDDWWEAFLQWCVIGVPASIFIYLSNRLMFIVASGANITSASPGGDLTIFSAIFSYAIPFLFLVIGFFITMSSGGQVGSTLKGYLGKGVMVGGAALGGAALGGAAGIKSGASGKETKTKAVFGGALGGLSGGFKGAITGGKYEKEAATNWAKRNIGERVGYIPKGTTAQIQSKNFNELVNTQKALSKEERRKIATSQSFTYQGSLLKQAAIQAQLDEKELNDDEIKWIVKNKDSAAKNIDIKKLYKYAPEYTKELTNGEKSTTDVLSTMQPKVVRDTVRSESLSNINIITGINAGQSKEIMIRGNQKQKDNLLAWRTDPNKRQELKTEFNRLNTERLNQNTTSERKAELKKQLVQMGGAIRTINQFRKNP